MSKGDHVAKVAGDLTSAEPVAAVRDQEGAVMTLLQQSSILKLQD